jgi:hypothetical protein
MKNTLTIIMDTEREEQILIGKPQGTRPPETNQELADMVILDLSTLCEALVVAIRTAHEIGINDEGTLMKSCINHIHEAFVDPGMEVEFRGGQEKSVKG